MLKREKSFKEKLEDVVSYHRKSITDIDELSQVEQDELTAEAIVDYEENFFDWMGDTQELAPLIKGFVINPTSEDKADALRNFILKEFKYTIKKSINYELRNIAEEKESERRYENACAQGVA